MVITLDIHPIMETRLRERIQQRDEAGVRSLLTSALDPIVDELMEEAPAGRLTVEEFERLADEMADEFEKAVGPNPPILSDYAVSREGIYEDHP